MHQLEKQSVCSLEAGPHFECRSYSRRTVQVIAFTVPGALPPFCCESSRSQLALHFPRQCTFCCVVQLFTFAYSAIAPANGPKVSTPRNMAVAKNVASSEGARLATQFEQFPGTVWLSAGAKHAAGRFASGLAIPSYKGSGDETRAAAAAL